MLFNHTARHPDRPARAARHPALSDLRSALRGEARSLHGDDEQHEPDALVQRHLLHSRIDALPMLRSAALTRTALVLALALWASPDAADQTIGATCSG